MVVMNNIIKHQCIGIYGDPIMDGTLKPYLYDNHHCIGMNNETCFKWNILYMDISYNGLIT